MKKFAMAVATVASLSTAAFADSCANSFSGFYAGVQAGMNSTTGDLKMDSYLDRVGATSTTDAKFNIGKKSFLGGLFVGYGMGVGSCAYVGAELYGNFGNTNSTLVDPSAGNSAVKYFKVTMQRSYALGGKVRLGYTVSPQAMIFLGLGLEYAKLQLKSENLQSGTPQTGVDTVVKKSGRKISFAPSIGMDMFVNKNLFLRGEFTYVMGMKQKVSAAHVGTVVLKPTAEMKVNMTQQRFALGLGYKF